MVNILAGLLILVILNWLWHGKKRDDTDPPGDRSGLMVFKDHRTGLHYLVTQFGSITPRMGTDGKQIGDAKK